MRTWLPVVLAVVLGALVGLSPRSRAQLAGTSGFTYTHISTATSTQIATAPVVLHTVVVNTAGTTITLFDNAGACSTTTVAVIGAVTGTFAYDINLKNGLCITTVGSGDVTVGVR